VKDHEKRGYGISQAGAETGGAVYPAGPVGLYPVYVLPSGLYGLSEFLPVEHGFSKNDVSVGLN